MNEFYIKALPLCASTSQAFSEATAEELRVLIAAVELSGKQTTAEDLAARAKTSLQRAKASLLLWESEGIIRRDENNVIDEFEPECAVAEAKRTAESIRKENLRALHEDVASILEKPALEREEISHITSLVTELGLSPEYIATLASYLKGEREASENGRKLKAVNIVNRARSLVERGIDTLETLERHIELSEKDSRDEREIRKLLGIWGRAISKSQKEYFRKWTDEYCFGFEILAEAYDIAALKTPNASLAYMDKVLKSWHEAGLKTAAECKSYDATHLAAKQEKRTSTRKSKTEPETPKYGNFDVQAAFRAALDRSYSDKK